MYNYKYNYKYMNTTNQIILVMFILAIILITIITVSLSSNNYIKHKKENYILITPECLQEINDENLKEWESLNYNSIYRYTTANSGPACGLNTHYKCAYNY